MALSFLKFFVLLQLPIFVLGGSMICALGRMMGSSMPNHIIRSKCGENSFLCHNATTGMSRCLLRTDLRCAERGTTIGRNRYAWQGMVPGTGCLSDHGSNYCGSPSIYSARMPNQVIIPDLAFYTVFLGASQLTGGIGSRRVNEYFGQQFIHNYIMFRGFIYDFGKTYIARELDPNDGRMMESAEIDRDWLKTVGISACTRGDVCFAFWLELFICTQWRSQRGGQLGICPPPLGARQAQGRSQRGARGPGPLKKFLAPYWAWVRLVCILNWAWNLYWVSKIRIFSIKK